MFKNSENDYKFEFLDSQNLKGWATLTSCFQMSAISQKWRADTLFRWGKHFNFPNTLPSSSFHSIMLYFLVSLWVCDLWHNVWGPNIDDWDKLGQRDDYINQGEFSYLTLSSSTVWKCIYASKMNDAKSMWLI